MSRTNRLSCGSQSSQSARTTCRILDEFLDAAGVLSTQSMSGLLISGSIAISRTRGPVAATLFTHRRAARSATPSRSKGAGHRRQIVRRCEPATDPSARRPGRRWHSFVVVESPAQVTWSVRNRSGNLRAMRSRPGDMACSSGRARGHANGSGDAASHGRKVQQWQRIYGPAAPVSHETSKKCRYPRRRISWR